MRDLTLGKPIGQCMQIDGEGPEGLDVVIVTVAGHTGHDFIGGNIKTGGIRVNHR